MYERAVIGPFVKKRLSQKKSKLSKFIAKNQKNSIFRTKKRFFENPNEKRLGIGHAGGRRKFLANPNSLIIPSQPGRPRVEKVHFKANRAFVRKKSPKEKNAIGSTPPPHTHTEIEKLHRRGEMLWNGRPRRRKKIVRFERAALNSFAQHEGGFPAQCLWI